MLAQTVRLVQLSSVGRWVGARRQQTSRLTKQLNLATDILLIMSLALRFTLFVRQPLVWPSSVPTSAGAAYLVSGLGVSVATSRPRVVGPSRVPAVTIAARAPLFVSLAELRCVPRGNGRRGRRRQNQQTISWLRNREKQQQQQHYLLAVLRI